MTDHLILFTRFPEPGRVKTRFIPALGKEEAAGLHRKLTEHCVQRISPVLSGINPTLHIFYTGGSLKLMRKWFPDLPLTLQQGSDLGQRMATAFTHARARGGERILLFGSDCPDLDEKMIRRALDLLNTHDLVLGPTFDGGYYLLGISPSYPMTKLNTLLIDIPWGTAEVLQKTLARADDADYSYGILPTLHDIDRPEDLEYFNYHTGS